MHIVVLGAGVIGLTTAWELAERGHEVTIVDRRHECAAETSFANGAQLSYSFVAPFASPETLRKLGGLLLRRTGPVRIKPVPDPQFLEWAMRFLAYCTDAAVAETTKAQLALSGLSKARLSELARAEDLSFDRRVTGKLVFYRKVNSFAAARRQIERQAAEGAAQTILSASECLALEPSLRVPLGEMAGGVYTPSEEVGDCLKFCRELKDRLDRRANVKFELGFHARSLIVSQGQVLGAAGSQGDLRADLVVIALGADAPAFVRGAGISLPIYPMKGYSITARAKPRAPALQHSVTDSDRKLVFAPLTRDGRPVVRVAGIADLVGMDREVRRRRLEALMSQASQTVDLDLECDVQPWTGLRPATPDSRPIIDWAPLKGLFLNVGHGALGWTLACGSACLAADLISRQPNPVRADWFGLSR
ncbi:FAD-dependent oxidoreductase [Bosea sp. F3-2]|uniref:D-amino acid dehydrogenase n=1 Tax=Bosea sp. F3-2 TaxID=2599640 RepID=UPI0011ECCAD3|nr:D-amino acid dehydrogenase [Bosea sp. F3-2]QEL22922.1 FAD-dependent oxidoreductase [Bosea sp. F3-2]